MKRKIWIALFAVSVLMNIIMALVFYQLIVVQSRVDFTYEIPHFNSHEIELIHQATPEMMKYSAYPAGMFVSKINETENDIEITIDLLPILQDCHTYVPRFPCSGMGYEVIAEGPGAWRFVFSKDMDLKLVDNLWEKDIVIDPSKTE